MDGGEGRGGPPPFRSSTPPSIEPHSQKGLVHSSQEMAGNTPSINWLELMMATCLRCPTALMLSAHTFSIIKTTVEMPSPSKRSRGKARKAAKTKQQQQQQRQRQEKQTEAANKHQPQLQVVGKSPVEHYIDSKSCSHGIAATSSDTIEFAYAYLLAYGAVDENTDNDWQDALESTSEKYRDVWMDTSKMVWVTRHFTCIAVNLILDGNIEGARGIASFASFFEQYSSGVTQK